MASEETVARISHLRGRGYTQKEIAEDVGLSPQMVSVILKQLREQSNEVKPVQVVVTQNLEPKDTVIEFTPAEFERLRQEQTIYAVEEKLYEIRPNVVHATTLPPTIPASQYAEIADIVESGFDLTFSHDFASERKWLANCHGNDLRFEFGVTSLEEIHELVSKWFIQRKHIHRLLGVLNKEHEFPWLNQRISDPVKDREQSLKIQDFFEAISMHLAKRFVSIWESMAEGYHPEAPLNYNNIQILRYLYDSGLRREDVRWSESGNYGQKTDVYRSSLLEDYLWTCVEHQPFVGMYLFLEALSPSNDPERRKTVSEAAKKRMEDDMYFHSLVNLLPFSEDVFIHMAHHLETDPAIVEQIVESGAPNQEALRLVQNSGSSTWEEHLEKQAAFNHEGFRLSEFRIISSLGHPKVERVRVALENEAYDDALIHAWTLFEVQARAMWEDDRIHRVLKPGLEPRNPAARGMLPIMTDESVEFQIRESNKRYNHRVLEMHAKPSGEAQHRRGRRAFRTSEQHEHVEIERYMDEALEFPVRVTRTQEGNGSGYVFTNVLAPFVLGDVEDDRHRWLDEARLIRNADLHGTQCSIELLPRHVRVVLELTELISTWKWK
jgi:transcriptional regulator with XRE-family HTH domain